MTRSGSSPEPRRTGAGGVGREAVRGVAAAGEPTSQGPSRQAG